MNYLLLFAVITLIIYIILTRSKQKPEPLTLIKQIEKDGKVFSVFEDPKGQKMLQTLFANDNDPELYSVYITDGMFKRLIKGKGEIKTLYTSPFKGFVHYARPSKKVSQTVRITDIKIESGYNPFREVKDNCSANKLHEIIDKLKPEQTAALLSVNGYDYYRYYLSRDEKGQKEEREKIFELSKKLGLNVEVINPFIKW